MAGRGWTLAGAALPALLAGCAPDRFAAPAVDHPAGASLTAEICQSLADNAKVSWPEAGTRVISAQWRPAGPAPSPPGMPPGAFPAVELPEHCDITGIMRERTGVDGQPYAIKFHLRLPAEWNQRLYFQGGGGTNGELGDAIGLQLGTFTAALAEGFAVLSHDSGHDNAINSVPERGGPTAFGFDPQARADYGGASLEPATLAARALMRAAYGSQPRYSYFVGCSKGGQEGMALAQRHPGLFDGIIAAAPGFSLPRAAIAEAWDTLAFAAVPQAEGKPVTLASLAASFSDADLMLVRESVLEACDADDGAADGIVGGFRSCTSEKVLPRLSSRQCRAGKQEGCLSSAQIAALEQVHRGPSTSTGERIYPGFPWDAGWVGGGWRSWKIGAADGSVPSINVAMGAPALATIFSTPPREPGRGAEDYLRLMLAYDFDRDSGAIDAVQAPFTRSAWADISARSSDLAAFRRAGGRMIVPHGVSDPVFSVTDTIDWWEEVDEASGGNAADFARVFPVPGMAHCMGGPATDRFDAFGALVRWVEQGIAPEHLDAQAGPGSPWPGRERPVCRYPMIAQSDADGEGFRCR